MTSQIRHITVDCADPYALAGFWAEVLGRSRHPDDEPGDDEVLVPLADESGTGVLFVRVPEGRSVKNRLHLDLQPVDRSRDDEVERLRGHGAAVLDDRRRPDGAGWVVLADPEGNEFCVERSATERG